MSMLILKDGFGQQQALLNKRVFTVGNDRTHDLQVEGLPAKGLLFTLIQKADGSYDCLPGEVARLKVNGRPINNSSTLHACDRIEWDKGAAVWLHKDAANQNSAQSPSDIKALQLLQKLASDMQNKGALQAALVDVLDYLLKASGAEAAYLLSERPEDGHWELTAQKGIHLQSPTKKDLFSNTVLKEALQKRAPVCVDSLIGHPWSEAASVIASRIFSVACLPLCIDEKVLGAVYLFTQTPGMSLHKDSLPELNLVATQAALMLGARLQLRKAQTENVQLRRLVKDWPSDFVLGESEVMRDVERRLIKLAPTPLNLLLLGETGTGKEVAAKELHRQSLRRKGPFVAINCAAIPESLLESTLFGHERGAFTGAVRSQPGKFVLADGGTLLLDEIGELPLDLQSKLLRVLQEQLVEPVGATKPVKVDIRIIAATHQDLESAVRKGTFRQDLYYRLNGATLRIPALRERGNDILKLAQHFLAKIDPELQLSSGVKTQLLNHTWPGNVRELEQSITRAALLCETPEIQTQDLELGSQFLNASEASSPLQNLKAAQETFTRDYVIRALSQNNDSRSVTAAQLGISERSLYRILSEASSDSLGSGG